MDTNDIIKAIAELDGWTLSNLDDSNPEVIWHKNTPDGMIYDTPDYLTSRDAIIPVIEKRQYCLLHRNLWWVIDEWLEKQDILPALKATPRQLSEALLRATGKWKD